MSSSAPLPSMATVTESTSLPSKENANDSGSDHGSAKNMSAIHGNFIPLQSSEGLFLVPPRSSKSPRRFRSRSPRRRQDQGVHLHLSLTDSQMDKLASTLGKDECSRAKSQRRTETALPDEQPQSSAPSPPEKGTSATSSVFSDAQQSIYSCSKPSRGRSHRGHRCKGSDSNVEFTRNQSPSSNSYPVRNRRSPERFVGSMTKNGRYATAPTYSSETSPVSPEHCTQSEQSPSCGLPHSSHTSRSRYYRPEETDLTDVSSSVYSADDLAKIIPQVNPLYIRKIAERASPDHQQPRVLQEYTAWSAAAAAVSPTSPGEAVELEKGVGTKEVGTKEDDVNAHPLPREPAKHPDETFGDPNPPCCNAPSFSPLVGFSADSPFGGDNDGEHAERRAHKVLVGHNGWLERTDDNSSSNNNIAVKKPSPSKKAGLLDTLKRVAKEVAEVADIKATRKTREVGRSRRSSRMRISLNPREQSLLYCELEFLLTSALDSYITGQFNGGRLDADKYKKVVDSWHQKGRPKVVGFRFDLETQLSLVQLHLHEFRFFGSRAGVPVAILGILDMMKVNARAMRIRTFCQPDSAIAKQLLDSQNLFHLIGCPEQRQIQLAEVVQFFKIVLERENHRQNSEETV